MFSLVKHEWQPSNTRSRYLRKSRVFLVQPYDSEKDNFPPKGASVTRDHEITTRAVLEEFLNKTTIPGLSQLGGKKGWISRTLWIGLFFTGIAMAVYQSRSLITEYRRYAVNERSVREIQWSIGFPSVTVCVNSPVRWRNYSDDPGLTFVENVLARMRNTPDVPLEAFSEAANGRAKLLMEEMTKLNESERLHLGFPLTSFVILCTWGEQNCSSSDFTTFNSLFYGNCFTFNAGFIKSKRKQGPKSQSLNVLLRSNFLDAYPYLGRDDGLVMLVHPPGTAPILDQRRLLNLFPGRWLKIGVSKTVFFRLPQPFSSKCEESKTLNTQMKSLFFSNERPYTYTLDACTESCLQNMSVQLCNCILPHLPLTPNPPDKICKDLKCDKIKEDGENARCSCSKPCRETIYDLRIDTDDRWLNQAVWQEWVDNALTNETRPNIEIRRVTGFEVYVASALVETVLEEPKISWADFLGSIGGNLGLWVGISIISMVELIEVIGKIVLHNAKRLIARQ